MSLTLKEQLTSIKLCGETLKFIETTLVVKKFIKEKGILTGSVAFGVETNDSDIDIIIPPKSDMSFSDMISKHNALYLHDDIKNDMPSYYQDGFRSCYVLNEGKIYNLLMMYDTNCFNSWVNATNVMLNDLKTKK